MAFGDKLLSFLQRWHDLKTKGKPKAVTSDEVEFLRSFLRVIDEDVPLNSTVRDILERHAEELTREIRSLRESRSWEKILQIRVRVREYFEYSSQYQKAIEFGTAYEAALKATGDELEALWVRVKDIGYMLILDEQYKAGRDEILSVLGEIGSLAPDHKTVRLRFYAHRYVGISHLRSKKPDVEAAKESFLAARDVTEKGGINNYTELEAIFAGKKTAQARIEGNFGNLELYLGHIDEALLHFGRSLTLFEGVDDIEHIGIANLQTAQALNRGIRGGGESHLDVAQQCFSRIGWAEGIGRVHFEKALMCRNNSMSHVGTEKQVELLKRARREAEIALQTFRGIRSAKWIGRTEQLAIEIEDEFGPHA